MVWVCFKVKLWGLVAQGCIPKRADCLLLQIRTSAITLTGKWDGEECILSLQPALLDQVYDEVLEEQALKDWAKAEVLHSKNGK